MEVLEEYILLPLDLLHAERACLNSFSRAIMAKAKMAAWQKRMVRAVFLTQTPQLHLPSLGSSFSPLVQKAVNIIVSNLHYSFLTKAIFFVNYEKTLAYAFCQG